MVVSALGQRGPREQQGRGLSRLEKERLDNAKYTARRLRLKEVWCVSFDGRM